MAVLDIRQYPDPVLKRKCADVANITPELHKLIDDMIETMYDAPGVGLAAPQVGISLRLAVIDVSTDEEKQPLLVLVNPEIVEYEGEVEEEEGCLSVRGYYTEVKRYEKVKVRAMDRQGNPIVVDGEGFLSRALQHELDHLDGMLFIDRLSPLKRELFKRRQKKQKEEGAGVS